MEARLPFERLLATRENVAGLFTLQPEGLQQMSGGIDLTEAADAFRIPVKRGRNINDPESVAWVRGMAPDVLLVVGWTQLLKPELLRVPQLACLGFHASLLPKYRGRAPVNWAILNGETETGNTMIVLEPGADEGDIVSQRRIPITEEDDCASIYRKVSLTECDMLDEVLPLIRQGCMPRRKQDSSLATVMPKRRPEDGLIVWHWTSQRLYDWVRALTRPYPGAFSYLAGQKVTIWKARPMITNHSLSKSRGTVELDSDGYPMVVTSDGYLKLLEVEREGQPAISGLCAAQTWLKPATSFAAETERSVHEGLGSRSASGR